MTPKMSLGKAWSSPKFPGVLQLTSISVLELDGGRKPSLETPEMNDLDTELPNCASDPIRGERWFDNKGMEQTLILFPALC